MADFRIVVDKDEREAASELLSLAKRLDKKTQQYVCGFLTGFSMAKVAATSVTDN